MWGLVGLTRRSSAATTGAIGFNSSLGCGLIEVYLSLVEKQWQAERNTDDASREDWCPSTREAESCALNQHKGGKRHGGEDDIHSKEGADTVRKKILNELLRVGAVRGDPWVEERVWYDEAEEAKTEVKMTRFHLASRRWMFVSLTPRS